MKLDFDKPFLDFDEKPILLNDKPLHMGEILSLNLRRHTKGDSSKLFYWAKKLHNKEVLDLDPTDATLLRNLVESLEIEVLYRAQWVKVFIDAKDVKD